MKPIFAALQRSSDVTFVAVFPTYKRTAVVDIAHSEKQFLGVAVEEQLHMWRLLEAGGWGKSS